MNIRKFYVASHSAFTKGQDGKPDTCFHGHLITEGKQDIDFRFVCPVCGASEEKLKHKNWYMSKETDEDLIIKCSECQAELNTEKQDELKKWIEVL